MNIMDEARQVRDGKLKPEDVAQSRRKQVQQLANSLKDQPDKVSYSKRFALARGDKARIGKATTV